MKNLSYKTLSLNIALYININFIKISVEINFNIVLISVSPMKLDVDSTPIGFLYTCFAGVLSVFHDYKTTLYQGIIIYQDQAGLGLI